MIRFTAMHWILWNRDFQNPCQHLTGHVSLLHRLKGSTAFADTLLSGVASFTFTWAHISLAKETAET